MTYDEKKTRERTFGKHPQTTSEGKLLLVGKRNFDDGFLRLLLGLSTKCLGFFILIPRILLLSKNDRVHPQSHQHSLPFIQKSLMESFGSFNNGCRGNAEQAVPTIRIL